MGTIFSKRVGVYILMLGLASCSSGESRRTLRGVEFPCDGGVCPDAATLVDAGSGGQPQDGSRFDHPDGHIEPVDATPGVRDATRPEAEAGPSCGNGKLEPGEQCDDGNRDGGDGCHNDCTAADCVHDADCRDALFCNGVEVCREGHCAPGLPVLVDDQVACTTDSCDEGSHSVKHAPVDAACRNLDVAPVCATIGPSAGKVVEQTGVCDVTTGCHQVASVVDDCLDDARHPTTYSCSVSGPPEVLKHEGTCTAGATICSSTSTVENQCGGNLPAPTCSGTAAGGTLTYHFGEVATCSGGASPACGSTDSTSRCPPGSPTCAVGKLTSFTPTCNAATGCGRTANAPTSCADSPDTCTTSASGPVFTTFTPACANGTSCGPATPSRTSCPPGNPTCAAGKLTSFTPTCNAATGCGRSANTPVSCPDPADQCGPNALGAPAVTTFAPTCASGTACGAASSTQTSCTAAAPLCAPAPVPTRRTFSPACNTAGTACVAGGTASDAVCASGAATCANATLTTHPANCTGAGVCGTTTVTTPCADPLSTCVTQAGAPPILTTFAPTCVGNACGATSTQTRCAPTGQNACSRLRIHTTWVGTCNASTETCGQAAVSTDCAKADSQTCNGITQVSVFGTCSIAGCGTTTTTHVCNQAGCYDSDTSYVETGCSSGTCSVTLVPCNNVGCNANTGACNIIQ